MIISTDYKPLLFCILFLVGAFCSCYFLVVFVVAVDLSICRFVVVVVLCLSCDRNIYIYIVGEL